MSEINIFELAARNKYRFESPRGPLAAEDLFELPLQSRDGFDLDNIAKTVNRSLKNVTEESFVATSSPNQGILETKLAIVKHVIAYKLEQRQRAENRAAKAAQRTKILAALDAKNESELQGMSREELLKQLNALDE